MTNELRAGDSLGIAPIAWEYDAVQTNIDGFFAPNIDLDRFKEYMNQQGAEGWELVNTVDINRGNGRTTDLLFFFKRPLRGSGKRR